MFSVYSKNKGTCITFPILLEGTALLVHRFVVHEEYYIRILLFSW